MNAVQALDAALAAGISCHIDGNILVLQAARKPPTDVLDLLHRHKAQILTLMRPVDDEWSRNDWCTFFEERAGIAAFDGGRTQVEGEANAFECCIAEWLNRHPAASGSERCFWCGKPEQDRHIVVPFGTTSHNHTWLHSACWPNWYRYRRETAIEALARLGISPGTQAREIETASLVRSQVGFSKPPHKN
jgi:hypothetical protein